MDYSSYFYFLLISYDSNYSNELFLLVNFGFQGQAPYSEGIRVLWMCEFPHIF